MYQRPKAPVAKRAVHVPQWSSGETIGYLSCDRAFTDRIRLRSLDTVNGVRVVSFVR